MLESGHQNQIKWDKNYENHWQNTQTKIFYLLPLGFNSNSVKILYGQPIKFTEGILALEDYHIKIAHKENHEFNLHDNVH